MSNIDNIINKLKDEANEKIEEIQSDAQKEIESLTHQLIYDANKEKDRILQNANDRAESTYVRISENAEIRIRDQRLVERQRLIDRVMKLSLERMNSKSDDEFVNDIKKVLKNLDDKNLRLQVPQSRVNALKNAGLGVEIDEKNFVDNGFILMSDKINYNYKYEDILQDNRDSIGPELVKFLSE